MSLYQKFCHEITDENGMLKEFRLDYPDNFNFGYDVVDRTAEEAPDKRALVWCNAEGEEHVFTFSDIRKYSNQMANVFRNAGIGRGDRVMLILKRHYEYWFAAVALHKLGAVMIPVTHMLTVSDLVYRMKASRPKAVVCTAQNKVPEKVREALAQSALTARLWCVQAEAEGFENITAAMQTAGTELERTDTKASDPMILDIRRGSSTGTAIRWPILSRRNTGSRRRKTDFISPWRKPAGPKRPGGKYTASGCWDAL